MSWNRLLSFGKPRFKWLVLFCLLSRVNFPGDASASYCSDLLLNVLQADPKALTQFTEELGKASDKIPSEKRTVFESAFSLGQSESVKKAIIKSFQKPQQLAEKVLIYRGDVYIDSYFQALLFSKKQTLPEYLFLQPHLK